MTFCETGIKRIKKSLGRGNFHFNPTRRWWSVYTWMQRPQTVMPGKPRIRGTGQTGSSIRSTTLKRRSSKAGTKSGKKGPFIFLKAIPRFSQQRWYVSVACFFRENNCFQKIPPKNFNLALPMQTLVPLRTSSWIYPARKSIFSFLTREFQPTRTPDIYVSSITSVLRNSVSIFFPHLL